MSYFKPMCILRCDLKMEGLANLLSQKTLSELKKIKKKEHQIITVRVNDPILIPLLERAKVSFTGQVESKWLSSLLSWLIPVLILSFLWLFLIRRMNIMAGMVHYIRTRCLIIWV